MLGWFKGYLSPLGTWATKIESWWALGSLVMGTGFFSWLGAHWAALASHGWAVVILAAIAATITVMLVVSLFLIALRFFRPLSRPIPYEKPSATGAFRAVEAKFPEKIKNLDRTAFLLSTAAITSFYRENLQDGLTWWNNHPRKPPFTTDSELRTEVERVEKFIDDLRANIGPSHWGAELYNVLQRAESDADFDLLRQTVPDGLQPFQFRLFHIACLKWDRIGSFLRRSVDDAKSYDLQNIQMIRERPEIHK